ncbi:MAG: TolC family protein, partial [Polyangiaceae bacterium]
VLASSLAQAQTQTPAGAAAPMPAQRPVPTTLAPPPAAAGAVGPDAPVSKVTTSLEAKLASMQSGNGLTADEAARRALVNNVDVSAKQKSLDVADAQRDENKSRFYPKLDLMARYTRISDIKTIAIESFGITNKDLSPVVFNNYTLQATLTIPLSDYVLRLSSTMASANHNKSSAKFDELATRLSVARDARVTYYQWIRVQGANYVAQQALEAARGHAQDAKNAFDAGLVSRADVLRTVSQEKSAELTVAHWNNQVSIATEQLRVMMNEPSQNNYEIGENILSELPPYSVPLTPDSGYAEALEHRLEMKQLGESEAALREQAATARAGNYPRLDAQGNALYANPNPRYFPPVKEFNGSWDASLILSWTPTAIFGATAQAKTAEAHADEVVARKGALKNGLRLEVNQSMNALAEANFGIEVSRDGLVAAEENYRVRRELYRAGKATIVEVTDAETELTRARLDVVNANVDLRVARVALTHALGRDVASQP